jgi:hypothetical protein
MEPKVRRIPPAAACVLAAIAAALHAQQAPSEPAQDRERELRAAYEFEGWPSGPRRDGIPLPSLTLEGWTAGPLRSDRGRIRRRFDAEGELRGRAFLVEAYVADDAGGAHQVLLSWLAGRQHPAPAARGSDRNLHIGDVAFLDVVRADGEAAAWIAFARGNVAVRLTNLDTRAHPDLDITTIARRLDGAVAARAELDPGAPLPRPTVTGLAAPKAAVSAGDVVRVDFRVTDPAGGTPYLEWVVGGPGQGYVEQHEDGGWYLHTTAAGKIELALEVTGSTGTFARETIELAVTGN